MRWGNKRLWLLGVAVVAFFLIPGSAWPHGGANKRFSTPRSSRTNAMIVGNAGAEILEWLDQGLIMARRGRGGGHGGGFVGPDRDYDSMWRQRYREWQSLPPETKRLLRERMQEWKRLSPRERELMRRRYEQWKSLSPEEQSWIRNQLRRWKELTPEEREMIRQMFMR